MLRQETEQQLKRRKLTTCLHHERLNPFPSMWEFPKGLQIINLINMWFQGNKNYNISPFQYLDKANVDHIHMGARTLLKMRQVMKKVEEFGKEKNVWVSHQSWTGAQITALWTRIQKNLDPYLRTESEVQSNNAHLLDKSWKGQISWKTCHNSMQKKKLFVGNKARCRRLR